MLRLMRAVLIAIAVITASSMWALVDETPSQPRDAPSTEAPPTAGDQGVESRGLPLPPVMKVPAQGLQPLPPGAFNRQPLRATSVFDTQFIIDATGPNPINSYLATYLATLIYPDFIDQLSGNNLQKDLKFQEDMHRYPSRFYAEFTNRTRYLFTSPTYTWIYGQEGAGYNPEAMVISTPKAVFVVFRGTDRVGAFKAKTLGYDWAEWIFTDFFFLHADPERELPPLAGRVHKGFWDSLKAASKVIRQGGLVIGKGGRMMQTPPQVGDCFPEKSFRECLVSEIREAAKPSKKVFIIGHSLGAAHAQVFAAYLAGHVNKANMQRDGIKPQAVYAIAAPHVGNDAFRDKLNELIGGKSRLQRFDFVNDPITMLPPYLLGPYQYGRAGTRIYYDDIQTVQVAVPERLPGTTSVDRLLAGVTLTAAAPGIALLAAGPMSTVGLYTVAEIGFDFCFHYPQWYLNAAWSAVPIQAKNNLPPPLPSPRNEGPDPRVYGGCINPLTVARGERSELGRAGDVVEAAIDAAEQVAYNTGQLFVNLLANPVADGTYYLRLLQGRKYLDISGSCVGKNGCKVQLWDIGQSSSNNRFKIKKEVGGYSLRNGSGDNLDFLEVDANELFKQYGDIQMWEANLPFGGHNANQLWHFYAVPNRPRLFVIRNVASGKVMTGKSACVNQNGCKVFQKAALDNAPTQVWVLEKVQ